MLKLILAFSGILLGLVLSHLASEELVPGRHYLLLAKRTLFILAILSVSYFLYPIKDFWFILLLIFISGLLLALTIRYHQLWLEIPPYLLLVSIYLLYPDATVRLLLASLLFLYGLPLGALLRLPAEQ
ncbi:TPA: hypothetical protein HA234_04640 [Candidatus Woesearchaeota archaeon]|nr:hypothetical protein [Candidatus Woesearchaeota archaeon]